MPIYIDCKYGHMIDIDYSRPEHGLIDVNAVIDIKTYTKWIVDRENHELDANSISAILEIREWFWEQHLIEAGSAKCSKQRDYHKLIKGNDMRKIVKDYVKPLAESLGLSVSED